MQISQTKDYELIARLSKHVHDVHSSLYPEYFKEYNYKESKDYFKSIIDKENYIFLLVEDEGQSIGFAFIEIRDNKENFVKKPYTSIYVHQFSISETKRNKGYGSKLMNEIYNIAKANGITKIELDYWTDNMIAKNFYKKQGFVVNREFVYIDLE